MKNLIIEATKTFTAKFEAATDIKLFDEVAKDSSERPAPLNFAALRSSMDEELTWLVPQFGGVAPSVFSALNTDAWNSAANRTRRKDLRPFAVTSPSRYA